MCLSSIKYNQLKCNQVQSADSAMEILIIISIYRNLRGVKCCYCKIQSTKYCSFEYITIHVGNEFKACKWMRVLLGIALSSP